MPSIEITREAHECLRLAAQYKLKEGAKVLPNGYFRIELEESTIEALEERKLYGETYSDLIVRVFHTNRHGVN